MYLAGTYTCGLAGTQLGVKTPLPIHEGASRHTEHKYSGCAHGILANDAFDENP